MLMANTAGNPLSAGSLALFMASSLPRDASPQIKNPFDAVALAVHAGMISVGFRLIGLGEDHKIEASSDAHDPHALPAAWNASSFYAFRYAHDQSSMEYLVKVNRLGTKAVILAVGLGDDKTASFEVVARDYISESRSLQT
ncbi:putative pi31 proteasome regulator [Diplodia seriata]|uniref:Putative pi31 proteasome regulator n=1 Tax=Diplodia seriata TaxID=420778 RepID=A0A0G2ET34_9PEZI|nr:putative pi31 proteasome regulator [Diplodia seriata]